LQTGEPLAWVHAADAASAQHAVARLQAAFVLESEASAAQSWQATPMVLETIASSTA
jgi:hypothetical protein